MERLFKLVPIRKDSTIDLYETSNFRTTVYGLMNMIELYKMGGHVEIPNTSFSKESVSLRDKGPDTMCRRLMKRFDEEDFMEKIYTPTRDKIYTELITIFNELFYEKMGYPNFSFVCCKEGGYKVALGSHKEGLQIVGADENTYNVLLYAGKVFGEAECLAIRNELIK